MQAPNEDAEVIHQLLSPWQVSFTNMDEADVAIAYNQKSPVAKETIYIPSDSVNFNALIKETKLRVVKKPRERVSVDASSHTVLTTRPNTVYSYDGLASLEASLLALDVVKEYRAIVSETLNAKSSIIYRLLTSSPLAYAAAPKQLKSLFMRERHGPGNLLSTPNDLPLDALRFILVHAIEQLSGRKLRKKRWNGKRYVCALTHDIDTLDGLQKARTIKRLEEKYDVPSAWYIPSKHYMLNREAVRELGNHGEIGSHDTKHDGRLAQLSWQKRVKRLREARYALQNIANCSVVGFRAPLLQHSSEILDGLKKAGYKYDTSIPTWEPKHPRTMRPHGLGTIYPMFFDGLTEIPVTAVQDHQLLYVLGLKTEEVIAEWLSTMNLTKELGGCCVFLSHPEYKLFDNGHLQTYEEWLNTVRSDGQAWLTTPKNLVNEAET